MFDTIRNAVCFYGKCARWAMRGTVEKANAWFWPVGVPIVAAVGWYAGVGVLAIPETIQDFFTFMVVSIAASWVVFFVIRFVGAGPHFYREAQDELERIAAQESAKFEFVYNENDDRWVKTSHPQRISYLFGLHILARQTIDFPNVWMLASPLTQRLFSPETPSGAYQIYKGGAMDPDVTEAIELFDLPPNRKFLDLRNDDDPLGGIQRFTLEARGRDCKPVRANFEYDPNKVPMIRMLP